ncbi:unannotated protein [freshwater metagenome]|uniref:Unannotated protein n=1 Tax=freshwater metagenome TaxID=449393 RepID=A0A6J6KZR2_9ZZZZ
MTKGTLPFNDDHIGIFVVEGFENGSFQLACNKLSRHGIKRHAVARALYQPCLAGAHHDRTNPMIIEGLRQDCCCCSLSNCAVCAKHRDPWAGHISDATRKHS